MGCLKSVILSKGAHKRTVWLSYCSEQTVDSLKMANNCCLCVRPNSRQMSNLSCEIFIALGADIFMIRIIGCLNITLCVFLLIKNI
jgi:hypothetical protein